MLARATVQAVNSNDASSIAAVSPPLVPLDAVTLERLRALRPTTTAERIKSLVANGYLIVDQGRCGVAAFDIACRLAKPRL